MIQQAIDFHDESDALYQLIKSIDDKDFQRKTQFKGWTINDVIHHLHFWNWAADLALHDPDAFQTFLEKLIEAFGAGISLRQFETEQMECLTGGELLQQWRSFYVEMSARFKVADPKKRVKWAGPEMSVRSSITARLMETWAHGQEVYDLLGVVRQNRDRIKNIALLGVNTFGWSFINRKRDVPPEKTYVKLTAPSGDIWEWNDPTNDNKVEGSAEEFCQVVTQTRNISDTSLRVVGETAKSWMEIAQCFAGPPQNPPQSGSRYTAVTGG